MARGIMEKELADWRRGQREAKAIATVEAQHAAVQKFLDLWQLIAADGAITTFEILADGAMRDALHIAMARPATMTPTLVSRYLGRLSAVERLANTSCGGIETPQWRLRDCR